MTSQAKDQASMKIEGFWSDLQDASDKQFEVLVPFAKDAMRDEIERSNQLDTKGNWTLVACLGLLSALSAIGRQLVETPTGELSPWPLVGLGVTLTLLTVGAILAALGTRVRVAWFNVMPERVIDPEVLGFGYDDHLRRRMILHYLDVRERNARSSDRRAGRVQASQWLAIAGVLGLAVTAGLRVVS